MSEYFIGWWNLENLFDVHDSQERPDWLQKELRNELEGWDQTVLNKKIKQLAKITHKMNEGLGPDVLGVCEVENKSVMDLFMDSLVPMGRSYDVEHHDTSDKRGIDVAFVYDRDKFTCEGQYFHTVLKRTATRDLFQVNFKTSTGKPLILIGNHWPSRRGGVLRSEPYRIIAGETLSYWNMRILEERGDDIGIVVMGDFNDEPHSRSIVEYALATNCETTVKNAKTPKLLNLMWPFLGEGIGTHYFGNTPNVIDQFMISKGIVEGASGFKVKESSYGKGSVKIEMFEEMIEENDYPVPRKFGRPSKENYDEEGFSDHYPISLILEETS